MSKRTPWLGATGVYELRSPWSVSEDVEYTCTGVVSFVSMLEKDIDVLTEVYLDNGLTKANYEADLQLNANLVILTSRVMETIYVPDTYIVRYPQTGNIPYSHIVASVSLGALPDDMDLSFLQDQISGVVSDVLGVSPTVEIHKAPTTGAFSPEEHRAMESTRTAAVKLRTTDRAKAQASEHVVESLTQKVKDLEQIIIQNAIANPTQ